MSMKPCILLSVLALSVLAVPGIATAQVSSPYVNVHCVWVPAGSTPGHYQANVYRHPSPGLVAVITDPVFVSNACTGVPSDLLDEVLDDLQNNGTFNGQADQLVSGSDVFCPGPDNPTVITSMSASLSTPSPYGPDQTSLVISYTCPGATTPGATPYTPTATYNEPICDGGEVQAAASSIDPMAVQMTRIGPSQWLWGADSWRVELAGSMALAPSNMDMLSSHGHCDPGSANTAALYLQNNIASLDPHDFGVDAWACPVDELRASVTSCTDHGTHATYGYRVDCCPPPTTTAWAINGFGACLYPDGHALAYGSVDLAYATSFLGPAHPTYNDPLTVCADMEADAQTWFDTNVPTGNPPCTPSAQAAAGGTYVPGTFHFTTCTVTPDTAQCGPGGFQVDWQHQLQCVL